MKIRIFNNWKSSRLNPEHDNINMFGFNIMKWWGFEFCILNVWVTVEFK